MKQVLLLSMVIATSIQAGAQLKVNKDGYVGIGTFMPRDNLQLGDKWAFHDGDLKTIGYNVFWNGKMFERLTGDECAAIIFTSDGSIGFHSSQWEGAGTPAALKQTMYINNHGFVSVGRTQPTGDFRLQVSGSALANSFWVRTDQQSSRKVSSLNDPLKTLAQLNGVSYFYSDSLNATTEDVLKGQKHYGFVVQDLQNVLPELVQKTGNSVSVNYIEMIPLLVEALKTQTDRIAALEEQIQALGKANLPVQPAPQKKITRKK